MSVKTVNHPTELHTLRNAAILACTFIANIVAIFTLYPIVDNIAFATAVLPAMVGGRLFGMKGGAWAGIASFLSSVVYQWILGLTSLEHIFQALIGGQVIILVGVAFGHFKDMGVQSKRVAQNQRDVEKTQKKLEKQLQQAQEMEAIGTLAGGVAHDMNNILGIIMSSASVLKHGLRGDEKHTDDVENILNACRRGRDLTRNLLGFARKGTYVKEIIDINLLVEESTRLLAPVVNKSIRLQTNLAGNLYQIYGDRTQIEQALLNICINASEAITGAKGTIRISTRNSGAEDNVMIEAHGLYSGDFAIIEISDTGHGIDAETLRHVFEPFYTTKSPGKGTGLGLSMAYGTMKNHGGGIDIKSTPGKGTKIIMMLPALISEQRVKVQRRIVSSPPPAAKSGSILLVDDEPLIRTSNKRMLKQLGYEVMLAESGERALQIYRDYSEQVFLVILDFVMPGINGAETFETLKLIDPDVKVIISSGYSKDGNIEAVLEKGALGFIQKPFDLDQLEELLQQMPKSKENRHSSDLTGIANQP